MMVLTFLIVIIILLVIYLATTSHGKNEFIENATIDTIKPQKTTTKNNSTNNVNESQTFSKTLSNAEIDLFKKDLFDVFLKYETAYSNLDYDTLKSICSAKHFTAIHKELENLKENNKKRVLSDITLNNFKIQNATNTNNIQKILATFDIALIDYTIDEIYNFNVKGNQSIKVQKKIKVCFERKFKLASQRQHCPKCGAPVSSIWPTCTKCNTLIFPASDWKIESFDG